MNDKDNFCFLEGENVSLLPVNSEHIKLYVKWETNPEVRRFSRTVTPLTVEEYKKRLEPKEEQMSERIMFEIWHKKDKKPIGIAELHHISWFDRRAGLGLLLGELEYWERNLATEAGKLLIDYGFKELNFYKITAGIISSNIGSWRCAEKIGMNREAILRNHVYVDGEYLDDFQYCIFKEEWLNKNE